MAGIWTMGELLVEIMRPQAGMPLDRPGEFLGPFPSGAPAIFIDTVARLGHPAGIIGGVGADDFGRSLLERLGRDGVDLRFVQSIPGRATAVAFVTYFSDGSRRFIFHIDGTPAATACFEPVAAEGAADFFHVMGCSLSFNAAFREQIFAAVRAFHAAGAKISFDPNLRPELLGEQDLATVVGPVLELAAVVMPGEAELRLLGGTQDLTMAIQRLFANPNLESVVLKRGEQGARVYTRQDAIEIPAYPVDEVDPTGAGDCFDAGFLVGLAEGKPMLECGKLAAAAGALNAAAFGPMEGKIDPVSVRRLIERGSAT